jgi:hypothetical protein
MHVIRPIIQFGESFSSRIFIGKIEGYTFFCTQKCSFWSQNTVFKLEKYSFTNSNVDISALCKIGCNNLITYLIYSLSVGNSHRSTGPGLTLNKFNLFLLRKKIHLAEKRYELLGKLSSVKSPTTLLYKPSY